MIVMNDLIFATNNQHKLEEVKAILKAQFNLKSLVDIGCTEDIPETADTLEGNAILKSEYIIKNFGLDCFADDSGLEVAALNNEPGVYSARYAGSRDMEQNIDLLLTKLGNNSNRRARFRTVISLKFRGQQYLFEGAINGNIAHARIGSKGFGYDPIFIPDGYEKSFAQMSQEEKNTISHRFIAIKQLSSFLKNR